MVRLEQELLPEPQSASSAREFLRQALSGLRSDRQDVLDTALLVVSELVANAVRHGRPPVTLAVTLDEGRVLLEVGDQDSGVPTVRDPGWESLGGRGLLLVDAMAASWGVRPHGVGKVVWAELDSPVLTVP